MPANVVSGRVALAQSGVGIPNLLVAIDDVAHDREGGRVEGHERETGERGARLATVVTDASGRFRVELEDEDLGRTRESRPNLSVVVLAPDGALDPDARVLHRSDTRMSAGRVQEYVIRITPDALRTAGIAIPEAPAEVRDPVAILDKLTEAVDWRIQVREGARVIAAKELSATRESTRRIDDAVERRLVESLSGLSIEEARALNIITPGETAEGVVRRTAAKRVDAVNAEAGIAGYLVLSEDDAAQFRSGAGWRSNISAGEMEPFLYRSSDDAGRPTSVTRTDPLVGLGMAGGVEDPLVSLPAPPASGDSSGGSGATSTNGTAPDEPVTSQDLPRFVGRLLNDMAPLDGNGVAATGTRPDAAAVQKTVSELRIGSGPADVTAFHDYHNLQIAFDHVWKHFVDDSLVEAGKDLARQIADAGGDPIGAMDNAPDPIVGLKSETQVIARVNNDPFGKRLPSWVTDLGPLGPEVGPDHPSGGGGGGGGPVPPPEDPPGGTVVGGGKPVDDGRVDVGPVRGWPGPRNPHELLDDLEDLLNERYKFEVFAPGSTNFGLLVTYRQKWQPVTYQAGDLVHTVTLAPKEIRKVSSKRTVKRDRSVKETETNLRNRADESKSTMRADAEVVDRASTKTNFNLSAKGTYNLGVASGDSTMTIDRTAEASSQETKKSFHENVMSAAMQLRSEKSWTFESKDTFEEETTESTELCNPNDELTCTYLFYELERRYRVSEHLHRLTPVVLVGMEVPNPGRKAIDRVLLAHSWIINRVLLDDRYRKPLEYLCERIVGDDLGLRQQASNVAEIRAAVAQLKEMRRAILDERARADRELSLAIDRRARAIDNENSEGFAESAWEWATGAGDDEDVQALRMIEDRRRETYDRWVREEKDIRMRLDAETAALSEASQAYAKAYGEHMNRMMEVNGLRAHFKENVLYYMQAIWSFTFQDQIFFSLSKVKAPLLTDASTSYAVTPLADPPLTIPRLPGQIVLEVTANLTLDPITEGVTLAEIADLDSPLGFKGNYMIFPLKKSNPLTDYMMIPYLDAELGLHDPDELGAWSPEDFAAYARGLLAAHEKAGDLTPAETEALEDRLRDAYRQIVSSPRRISDEVVVPSNSLFIEALPGSHALLEDFKLAHRQMDVEKVREETRKLKLESLRYAARILDEQLSDPEIERQTVITGPTDGVTVPVED